MAAPGAEAKVVTFILELPFSLPIPDDWQMAPLIARTPAWEGWSGSDFWKLLEWPGSKSLPDKAMPGTQLRFRRVSVRSAPPLRAADEAFADKVRPQLNRRERLARWWGLRRADRGVHFMRSVVSMSTFVAPPDTPEEGDSEEELVWLRKRFYESLGDLNRFLTGLSMAAADWRIGRLGAGQLPPVLPIIVDHVRPGDSPGRWPIHLLVSIRPDAPEPRSEDDPPPDFAWRASGMLSGANKGMEPYMEFFALVEDAWAYSLLGESTRCVITLGTAVEVLVSTTIREAAVRLGWSVERSADASSAWLKDQVGVHLAHLLGREITLEDPQSAWGAWWSTTYRLRNAAVHDGRQLDADETVAAKEATARVIRELRADLAAQESLGDLASALKIDFTDDEHDFQWRMIQVLPFSLRRIREAASRAGSPAI